jgi:hypothetical protein
MQYAEHQLALATRKARDQARYARSIAGGPGQYVALSRLADLLREQQEAEDMRNLIRAAPSPAGAKLVR